MADSSLNNSGLILSPIDPRRLHPAAVSFVKDGIGDDSLLTSWNLFDLWKATFPAR